MEKETRNKIASCKALQGKSVADIIATDKFQSNLAAYWTAQREDRKAIRASYNAMRKMGGAKGMHIPAHCIDDLKDMSVEDLAVEYAKVINGSSKRNAAERKYIAQIGQQAYNLTIAQIIVEEFPELADELLPKTHTS